LPTKPDWSASPGRAADRHRTLAGCVSQLIRVQLLDRDTAEDLRADHRSRRRAYNHVRGAQIEPGLGQPGEHTELPGDSGDSTAAQDQAFAGGSHARALLTQQVGRGHLLGEEAPEPARVTACPRFDDPLADEVDDDVGAPDRVEDELDPLGDLLF